MPSTTSRSTPTTGLRPDHGRLKALLRPMRGLKTTAGTRRVSLGHSFIQNLRRGHYEIAVDVPSKHRVAEAFAELALMI